MPARPIGQSFKNTLPVLLKHAPLSKTHAKLNAGLSSRLYSWSIFIAIGFAASLVANITTVRHCSGSSCGPSVYFILTSLVELVLALYCAFIYFKSNPSPVLLTWNYVAWILLAIMASTQVIALTIVGVLIMTNGIAASVLIPGQSGEGIGLGIAVLGGIVIGIAALVAIPMIINSVLAHKNKAHCSCSNDTSRY